MLMGSQWDSQLGEKNEKNYEESENEGNSLILNEKNSLIFSWLDAADTLSRILNLHSLDAVLLFWFDMLKKGSAYEVNKKTSQIYCKTKANEKKRILQFSPG